MDIVNTDFFSEQKAFLRVYYIMKQDFNQLPDLDERMDFVRGKVRRVRRRLERQLEEALIPLDIQEDFSISELQGDVMIVSRRDDDLQQKIRELLRSEGYRYDIPERTAEAIGLLKLRKYRMIIADCTRARRSRLYEYISRYQPHVKIITIVSNDSRASQSMRWGGYSFLLGHDFDPEQLRTCLISSLRMRHSVCWLLAHGERCNRSCVNSYDSDEDLGELE